MRLWPLSPAGGERSRILIEDQTPRPGGDNPPDVDPGGKQILVGSRYDPRVFLVPLAGGEPRLMPGFTRGQGWVQGLAFSPDGRLAVAAGSTPIFLRIWDLESGEVRTLDTRVPDDETCNLGKDWEGLVYNPKFLADGRLRRRRRDAVMGPRTRYE